MYQNGRNFIKNIPSRYSFTEFTYILIIFKGCYDAGGTSLTGTLYRFTFTGLTHAGLIFIFICEVL